MRPTPYDQAVCRQIVTWASQMEYQVNGLVSHTPRKGRHVLILNNRDHQFEIALWPLDDSGAGSIQPLVTQHWVQLLFSGSYRIAKLVFRDAKGAKIDIEIQQPEGAPAFAFSPHCVIDRMDRAHTRLNMQAVLLTNRLNTAFAVVLSARQPAPLEGAPRR